VRCFFFGGGLRIYYTFRNEQLILLLSGGTKTGQNRDIEKAGKMILEAE
jgi:putative addiction module killer protein